MTAPEPKPCPKCGSRVLSTRTFARGGEKTARVTCLRCRHRGPEVDGSFDEAIKAWNREEQE